MTGIGLEIDGQLARVTLARPEERNRLTRSMLEALLSACASLRDDTNVRVVIFRGEGSDFSA
jgi:enoyl-CoA hydratase/carnithine racemase